MDGFLLEGQERSGSVFASSPGSSAHVRQLYARRGTLPAESTDTWTSFEMTLREDAPIPVAFDFTRFLASSITFMSHLSEISVYFDDKRLAHLTKASGIPRQLTMPKGLQSTSRLGIMNVKSIRSHRTSV